VDAVPVVWIAPSSAERPRQADRALEEWGRARGFLLSAPAPSPAPDVKVDLSIADGVEVELEKARDATSARDADGAERSLARAETLLRDHPELPQGAWLMAEVERGWSNRWARVSPMQPERAAAAWRRARGLDGGRAAALGEEATPAVDPDVGFVLALDGPGDVRLDGLPVASGPLHATAGDHQVTVTRRGRLVWADWVSVTEGATVRVALPEAPGCSAEELSRVRLEGGVVHADGVACERWVVAEPGPKDGAVLVSACAMDRCGALLEWRVGGVGLMIPGDEEHRRRWPAWLTWTLVGVGAAAVAGVTIGIDEAFQPHAPEAAFEANGARTTRRKGL
jgi:hypothetical protein